MTFAKYKTFLMIPLFSVSPLLAQRSLTPAPMTPAVNAATSLMEEESGPTYQPTPGDIKKDHPHFPSFYFGRSNVDKTPRDMHSGDDYQYEIYLMEKDGMATKGAGPGKTSVDIIGEKAQVSNTRENQENNEWKSFDGKWSCIWTPDQNKSFLLMDISTQKGVTVSLPEDNCFPLYWNPQKELFYFQDIQGETMSRSEAYWQFDPNSKSFIQIVKAGWDFNLSPDGKWVVWSEGFSTQVGGDMHIYSVEKNVDYSLPTNANYNTFYKWNYADTKKKKSEVNDFIHAGKQLFLKHQHAEAILQYQKAIDQDPNNSSAYGYLGYSEFRMGNNPDAIRDLEKSIELDHWNKMSYYNLALAYWANHQKKRAIDCLAHIPYQGKAVPAGYFDKKPIQGDPQFKEIIHSPEFKKAFNR